MKTYRLLALTIGLTMSSLSFAQVLIQSSNNQREVPTALILPGATASSTVKSGSTAAAIILAKYPETLDQTL